MMVSLHCDHRFISGGNLSIQRKQLQLLHFIECDLMCYGALKSNTEGSGKYCFQCSITHHIAQNEVL